MKVGQNIMVINKTMVVQEHSKKNVIFNHLRKIKAPSKQHEIHISRTMHDFLRRVKDIMKWITKMKMEWRCKEIIKMEKF